MDDSSRFLSAFDRLPDGHVRGSFEGRPYGVSVRRSADGRRAWLFAEELGGTDHVSFNLFRLREGAVLKPCEMPEAKVLRFVEGLTLVRDPS